MAYLTFNPNHNICTILDVNHPNAADFLEAIMFLQDSNLMAALNANRLVYSSHLEEFLSNANVVENNGIINIHSPVQGTSIVISEAVIRHVLQLNDAMGIDTLEQDDVHGVFRRLGYEGAFPKTMVKKSNVSDNWRFLIHVFIHCLSAGKGGFDEMSFNLSSGFATLVTGRDFNFSGFIFNNMKRNIEDSKIKFLLYPRFLQLLINSEVQGLMPDGDILELKHMNWKVFNNMKKNHPKSLFSGTFTHLFPNMLPFALNELVQQEPNVAHPQEEYVVQQAPVADIVQEHEHVEKQVVEDQEVDQADIGTAHGFKDETVATSGFSLDTHHESGNDRDEFDIGEEFDIDHSYDVIPNEVVQ